MTSPWRSLERDFRDIPDPHGSLRADWSHHTQFPNRWDVTGAGSSLSDRFEAVAVLAGKHLVAAAGGDGRSAIRHSG